MVDWQDEDEPLRQARSIDGTASDERVKYAIGYAWQARFLPGGKHHVVVPDPNVEGVWRLRCSGGRGTFEYNGFENAVNCWKCQRDIKAERKEEAR
jgi:hypothetical protein